MVLPALTVTSLILMTSLVTSRQARVVDLTHDLSTKTIFWPGQPPFNFTTIRRGVQDFGGWLEVNSFGLGEHGGTHVDAPAHFAKGRWRTHQIPPSRLVGPGVVVDIRSKVKDDADYQLTTEDLMKWETKHGRLPDGAVVLIQTGWSKRYPDPYKVFNTQNPDDPESYHFPGISVQAARWLVGKRNITALGTETPSPDHGSSKTPYVIHQILLGHDILLLEQVTNLDLLPTRGATIVIGVAKLQDGSGGPARILGLLKSGYDAVTSESESKNVPTRWLILMSGLLSVLLLNILLYCGG